MVSNPVDRLFEKRLFDALTVARSGHVAIVIVPRHEYRHLAITKLAHMLDRECDHNARWTQDSLHFEGTRGSVRLYSRDHITYDAKLKRIRSYPIGTQTFLHPDVEEASS